MSYKIFEIKSRHTWERFLLKNSPQSLFQSWWWGEITKKQSSNVSRFGFYAEQKLVAIFQVVLVKAKKGWFLHLRHGPIFSQSNQQQIRNYLAEILPFLYQQAEKYHAWYMRLSPLLNATQEFHTIFQGLHLKPSPIHEMDAEVCWVLDLHPSLDSLLSNMRKTTRYEIRQAEKIGVEVIKSRNVTDLQYFHQLYSLTSKRQHFVEHQDIDDEFEIFSKHEKAFLYLAFHNSRILAVAIIVYYGGQAIYRHGASIPGKIPASYLLQWKAIQDAKENNLNVYNFWGVSPADKKNHPWYGISLFKRGFGGREVRYLHAHDAPISKAYWFSRGIELFRKYKRGYI